MSVTSNAWRLLGSAAAVGFLLCQSPSFAQASAVPLCGGDKSGKEVKKPKDEGEKPNPAAADALCGGDKSGKEVKKPKDEGEKRPNPA